MKDKDFYCKINFFMNVWHDYKYFNCTCCIRSQNMSVRCSQKPCRMLCWNPVRPLAGPASAPVSWGPSLSNLGHYPRRQFTKRRIRMFITIPRARNVNKTDDPP